MKNPLLLAATVFLSVVASGRSATVRVDAARSRIQVDVKATGHRFTGELTKYSAKAGGNADSGKPTNFDLSWDFADLKTGDEKRDRQMLKWLGGGMPKGSFSFQNSRDATTGGGNARGTLTINGASKPVAFAYRLQVERGWVTIDGSVPLDYRDFGLPLIRSMAIMTVDPRLTVRFHIVGKIR